MDLSPSLARTSPGSATFGECCWERGGRASIPCSRNSRAELAVWGIPVVPNAEPVLLCPGTWCSCRSRGICTTAGSCARRRTQRCWLPTSCRVGLQGFTFPAENPAWLHCLQPPAPAAPPQHPLLAWGRVGMAAGLPALQGEWCPQELTQPLPVPLPAPAA